MLFIEHRVNEDEIGTVGVRNLGRQRPASTKTEHQYKVYMMNKRDGDLYISEDLGTLWHVRDDGAAELTRKVFEEFGSEINEGFKGEP